VRRTSGGSWLLALGSWLLALGSWLLALGSWLLMIGRKTSQQRHFYKEVSTTTLIPVLNLRLSFAYTE
jgi:hypothetical protein